MVNYNKGYIFIGGLKLMNISLTIKNFLVILTLFFVTESFTYNKSALDFLKIHKRVRGTNLEDLDFSYANLAGIDLSKVKLNRANFQGANLEGANLSCADLSEAIGVGANMSGANLCEANLTRFKGLGCKLVNANLSKANLSRAQFSGDCSNAQFDDAILYQTEFNHAVLICASFKRADLACIKFLLSDIRNVDFSDSNLTQADFHGVRKQGNEGYMNIGDWNTINFYRADLGGAYMLGCLLSRASLREKGAINVDSIRR